MEPSTSNCLTNTVASTVKSPWGNNSFKSFPKTTFEDVMSEQLAVQLQLNEEIDFNKSLNLAKMDKLEENVPSYQEISVEKADTSNDIVLAQLLQAELDKEYNDYISFQEQHVNKNSKVTLSYSNYRTDEMFVSPDDKDQDSSSSEDEIKSNNFSDQMTDILKFKSNKGYIRFGNEVVTKHDEELCGRKNTARLENSFPTNFRTGDATGMDLQLSNHIYNKLKKHAFSEQKRDQRLHENKLHSTAEHALDEKTRLIIHRIIDRGILSGVNGVVSIGKEAVVIHGDGGNVVHTDLRSQSCDDETSKEVPRECVVKVFKTTLNEFKARDKYIKDDYRFKDRCKKLNPRKLIHLWAEKEMHNLNRISKSGIPCPRIVFLKKHVLVMSFIGTNHQPAPKLKDAILTPAQKVLVYEQVIDMMKTLFKECKLVHADLNEFNLLWHDEMVWMIDVSQSVEPSHPRGLEFLLRDCNNISKFFNHIKVANVLSPLQLFNEVSGLEIPVEDPIEFLKTIRELQSSSEEHANQGRNKSSQIFQHSQYSVAL